MEALVEDIEAKPTVSAPTPVVQPNPDEPKAADDPAQPQPDKPQEPNMEQITADLKKKFNIDQMTQEKEAEISKIVAQLDQFKQEIDESQARAANF